MAVDPTDYLEEALRRASGGARIAELAAALVEFDPDGEVSPEEATEFIIELIDSQLLVSDLSPPVTGPEAIHDLIDQLGRLRGRRSGGRAPGTRRGTSWPASTPAGRARRPTATGRSPTDLEELPTPVEMARLFQLDMIKPADHPVLGEAVLDEVVRGIGLLRRLAARRTEQLEALPQGLHRALRRAP